MIKARRKQRKPIKMTFGRCIYAEGVKMGMFVSVILAMVGILFTAALFRSDAVLFAKAGESAGFDLSTVSVMQWRFVLLSHVIVTFFAGFVHYNIRTYYDDGYPIPDSIGDALMNVGRLCTIPVMLIVTIIMYGIAFIGVNVVGTIGSLALMITVKIAILFVINKVICRTIEL